MPPLKPPSTRWGTPEEIGRRIENELDPQVRTRLTAIRMLMEGAAQQDVAGKLGVSTGTIRNWRRRWDAKGIAGLRSDQFGGGEIAEGRKELRKMGYDVLRLSRRYSAMVPIDMGMLWVIERNRLSKPKPVIFRAGAATRLGA
ncbi:MAG: helix-turn-helix domain-containing protein [Myxococcales bacterium]|nr:MAG: helix-turn-helix domain-containing protein [Myxococcales bacterium]